MNENEKNDEYKNSWTMNSSSWYFIIQFFHVVVENEESHGLRFMISNCSA